VSSIFARQLRVGLQYFVGAALGMGALLGCSENTLATRTSPRWQISILDVISGRGPVDVPESVSAGVPFTITINTLSGGCVEHSDSVRVTENAGVTTLIPYDRNFQMANSNCVFNLLFDTRTVQLQIGKLGSTTIAVTGLKFDTTGDTTVSRVVAVGP